MIINETSKRDPDLVSAGGSRTWSVSGRNFVVAVTELEAGDRLTEHDLPDEYVLLVQDDAMLGVEHDGRALVSVSEPALVVVPAGTSTVHSASSTTVVRVFTARCDEQMRRAVNHAAGADPRTAPLPEPTKAGDRIRIHRLRDIPDDEGRLGRIFRTTSLMENRFPAHEGPRDTERLSPHSHEDFERMPVPLVGDYAHHLRVPRLRNRALRPGHRYRAARCSGPARRGCGRSVRPAGRRRSPGAGRRAGNPVPSARATRGRQLRASRAVGARGHRRLRADRQWRGPPRGAGRERRGSRGDRRDRRGRRGRRGLHRPDRSRGLQPAPRG